MTIKNSLIAQRAYFGEGDDKALAINAEAKAKQKSGEKVINASVGMLFTEDAHLSTLEIVDKELLQQLNNEGRSYPSVSGGDGFRHGVLNWLLGDSYDYVTSHYEANVVATCGGTGAIVTALRNYIEIKQSVLIPSPGWANYRALIRQNQGKPLSYTLFDEFLKFNLTALEIQAKKLVEEEGRLTIIINDPSQNPTGYTLDETELDSLIALLNNISNNYPVVVIFDIAYIDFAASQRSRLIFKKLDKISANVLPLFCFSASKTFAVYGLRLGALIGIHKDKDIIEKFFLSSIATVRALWSCANAHAINTIANLLGNKDNRDLLSSQLSQNRLMLEARGKLFSAEAQQVNLAIFPYRSGFFVTIKCPEANKIADELKKENLFVLPMQNEFIRLALSSLSLNEIKGLAKIIKEKI